MTDFDGGVDAQWLAAIRTSLASNDSAQVGVGGGMKIMAGGEILQVVVFLVRPGDQVLAACQSPVDQ